MNVLPRPGVDVEPDLAAEQPRQLAADRQAEAGAAVLAAGRAVGLLERLEDDLLLVGGMPMPVSVTANASTSAARFRSSLSVLQPPCDRLDGQRHLAVVRELERVGEQVLDDLLQPLGVGEHRLGQPRVEVE